MQPLAPSLELALVGNCEVAALIDERATVVWACLPRLDGDPVFNALLSGSTGQGASGVFALDLEHVATSSQRYLRNTAILETTLCDGNGGTLRVVDFCPRFRARGRMFRPMGFVRIVEPLAGRPVANIRLTPRFDHGAVEPVVERGSHHLSFRGPDLSFRVTTNASLSAIMDRPRTVIERPLAFILGPDHTVEDSPLALATQFLDETRDYWQEWVRSLAVPFEWQEAVIRAAISLKLCTYEDTGAVLAALTTSVPESPGSGRNWDYRYCWLRDSYFVIQALNRLGATRTLEGYVHFIEQVTACSFDRDLQPLFSITADTRIEERIAPALPGYRNMGPVRIGNHAYLQRQNDVYGAVVLASAHSFFDERMTRPGDAALFRHLEQLGQRAVEVYDQPDAGPWEFRGFSQVHTFSAAMCWAGCDRLARIARRLGRPDQAAVWQRHAQALRERILAGAWNEELQAFTGGFGGRDLDATALLLPELGLLDARDPRFLSTLAAVERDLEDGDWLYRYRHDDDFGRPATAFTICAFWYVNALAAVGRAEEARQRFERLLARRTRLGLLSEDIDPVSGELWGNFPQTYSLVGIINSAIRLSRPWESGP